MKLNLSIQFRLYVVVLIKETTLRFLHSCFVAGPNIKWIYPKVAVSAPTLRTISARPVLSIINKWLAMLALAVSKLVMIRYDRYPVIYLTIETLTLSGIVNQLQVFMNTLGNYQLEIYVSALD